MRIRLTSAGENSRCGLLTAYSISIIFLDIDYFKVINDAYGHSCGDKVLVAAAGLIKDNLRSSDVIFRVGGEEFVIVLSDTDLDGAKFLAERIRKAIESHTLAYDMVTIKITASLGIYDLHENDTADTLIKNADNAMYKAKHNGRNQVCLAG